jgi:hypothetical protein
LSAAIGLRPCFMVELSCPAELRGMQQSMVPQG